MVSGSATWTSPGKLVSNASSPSLPRPLESETPGYVGPKDQSFRQSDACSSVRAAALEMGLTHSPSSKQSGSLCLWFSCFHCFSYTSCLFLHQLGKLLPSSHKLHHFLKRHYFWKDWRTVYNYPLKFFSNTIQIIQKFLRRLVSPTVFGKKKKQNRMNDKTKFSRVSLWFLMW